MLLIFDFDGTLANTWPWLAEELVAGSNRLGYRPVTLAQVEALRRLDTRRMFEALGIQPERLPLVAADLRRRAELAASSLHLFDHVPRLIRALHERGTTLAIVTSNRETVVRIVMGEELFALFKHCSWEVAPLGKAAALRDVMRRARSSPAETVAIGDETADLDAADSAGVRGVAVEWGFADADLLRTRAPGQTAATPSELLDMLTVSRLATRPEQESRSSN